MIEGLIKELRMKRNFFSDPAGAAEEKVAEIETYLNVSLQIRTGTLFDNVGSLCGLGTDYAACRVTGSAMSRSKLQKLVRLIFLIRGFERYPRRVL